MDNFDKMYSLFLQLEEEIMNATDEDVLAMCRELKRLAHRGVKNVAWNKRLKNIEE